MIQVIGSFKICKTILDIPQKYTEVGVMKEIVTIFVCHRKEL